MAAPTTPTLAILTTEGLWKAGFPSPATATTTRAQTEWFAEIKHDVWRRSRKLKSLITSYVHVTSNGKKSYANQTDFQANISMEVMYGTEYGTAQAGAAGTITLAATANLSDLVVGREIMIYSGTGANQIAIITAYNNSTKVATINPNWTTNPDNTSKYMIIDTYKKLRELPIYELEAQRNTPERGIPDSFGFIDNATSGDFILLPTPYRTEGSQVFGVRQRYYANLLTLDLAGTLMTTLYHDWRDLWVQGVYMRMLQSEDDGRFPEAYQLYRSILNDIIIRETIGEEISTLQRTVE